MRIIFMGTPEFAVGSLSKLLSAGYRPVAVVTAPDKPAGRGQKLGVSAVKRFAESHGLPVLRPPRLKDESFLAQLRELAADVQIVVAFRMLPEQVWNMPPLGTFNLHASLLPQYRGAAPINWAIIRGEQETGVTTFRLKHEIDSGEVLFREKVAIPPGATAGELHDQLMQTGADLLLRSVKAIEHSHLTGDPLQFLPQDESKVTHAPKLTRDTCRISWDRPAAEIRNLVRGLSPHPCAFTVLADGVRQYTLKIFRVAETAREIEGPPGTIQTDGKEYLSVKCSKGTLDILELQLEGKKRMDIAGFLRGFMIKDGFRAGG
jgi:methionyl-tRNA formyltransferase